MVLPLQIESDCANVMDCVMDLYVCRTVVVHDIYMCDQCCMNDYIQLGVLTLSDYLLLYLCMCDLDYVFDLGSETLNDC